MTVRFAAPLYPGGRHCLLCGTVTVGVAVPPAEADGKWLWRSIVADESVPPGGWTVARSEAAAKNALLARFRDFLRAAELAEAT